MVPELGLFSLIISLFLAIFLGTLPMVGVLKERPAFIKTAIPLTLGQVFFIILSFLVLGFAFSQDDFSVQYVALHSNSALPYFYKIAAIWGGHEGSLLLWVFFLNLWMLALVFLPSKMPLPFKASALSVLGWLNVGFLLFLLTTSNPFTRLLPRYPFDGQDLNPLLQDIGLVVHPPLLYLGYVGLCLPYAFALSTLIGSFEENWAKWARSWTLLAIAFLTVGIVLGSFWAYYELGWGGWWFWDPVENASLMPWIAGIALFHSLIVADKRHTLHRFSIFIAILAFGLSLLGTFLVRSGILSSVHAFATDPKRGIYILIFFLVVIGGSFLLYAIRAKRDFKQQRFPLFSRESLLLLVAIILIVMTLSILLGTLYPLLYEILTGRKISVGFPYFNRVFVSLMLPILVILPFGPFVRWGENSLAPLKVLLTPFLLSVVLGMVLPWMITKEFSFVVSAGVILASWIILGSFQRLIFKLKNQGLKGISLSGVGMVLAHAGVGVIMLGILIVSNFEKERDLSFHFKERLKLGTHTVILETVKPIEGDNYIGYQAHFRVEEEGKKAVDLFPEKRQFVATGTVMTETALDGGFFRDIYIALGEQLSNQGWSAKLYYKPFIRFIWGGALMIALGCLLSAFNKFFKGRKG